VAVPPDRPAVAAKKPDAMFHPDWNLHGPFSVKLTVHGLTVCRQNIIDALAAKKPEAMFDEVYTRFEAVQASHDLVLVEGTHEDGPIGVPIVLMGTLGVLLLVCSPSMEAYTPPVRHIFTVRRLKRCSLPGAGGTQQQAGVRKPFHPR